MHENVSSQQNGTSSRSRIVRFDTNIPQEVSLRFAQGKEVEGQYGAQFLYSLEGDQIMYVSPKVADRIGELNIEPGERFSICKREVKNGNGRKIEWEVKRVDPPRQQVQAAAAASVQTVQAIPNNPNTDNAITRSPIVHTQLSEYLGGILVGVIDAIRMAQEYGAAKGVHLKFNEQQVQALATTVYIQQAGSSRGPSWQQ